jgi:hypothetical protein
MLIEILWPTEVGVVLDVIGKDGYSLIVTAHGSQESVICPLCGTQTIRISGHHHRHPAESYHSFNMMS